MESCGDGGEGQAGKVGQAIYQEMYSLVHGVWWITSAMPHLKRHNNIYSLVFFFSFATNNANL